MPFQLKGRKTTYGSQVKITANKKTRLLPDGYTSSNAPQYVKVVN